MPVNVSPAVSAALIAGALVALTPAPTPASAASTVAREASRWPQWQAYRQRFIQRDGRVIEHSQQGRTTSEGQAYALFHALVANDRAMFARLLDWTAKNLARGDLSRHLPAWLWGRRDDGSWGVIDANAASDADMWLAWTLLEAGERWRIDRYRKLGERLLRLIEQQETTRLPGLGAMLLPGPRGFHPDDHRWKLNPSYLPLQLMRHFARVGNAGLWNEIAANTVTLIERASADGIVPDWVIYRDDGTLRADGKSPRGEIGYDAIRVYLWAGMLPPTDPLRSRLLRLLNRNCGDRLVASAGDAPGIRIALAPLMKATGNHQCLSRLVRMVDHAWRDGLLGDPARYYDQNLSMFALAWLEKRFAFKADGGLRIGDHETR